MKVHSILATIGNTPHLRINRLFGPSAEVWVKLERSNPGGSIKDRIALSMIDAAEQQGLLTPDSVIIEPTSGNTGIGAGFVPSILNTGILDGIIKVSKDEAMEFARRAAKEEGLLCGISSGASLAAVNRKIKEIPEGSRILTFSYDTGERYLSIEDLF